MKYGYLRASLAEQSVEPQLNQLIAAGCNELIREVASCAKTSRPAMSEMIRVLQQNDVVVVTSLDQLAKSTTDLLSILRSVFAKGAHFVSLADLWADTTTPSGALLITILDGLAEFERRLIKSRTAEGRARAKKNGVRLGRKHKLTAHQQEEIKMKKLEGASVRELSRSYNVSPNTISRVR